MLRPGFALLAPVLIALLGACGQTFSEVRVDDSKNGQSVQVHSGDVMKVTLSSTYWAFEQSSDPPVLKEVGDQAVTPDPIGSCLPGMGCGVTTAWYKALSAGSAAVAASRVSCGEAMRCVGDQGVFRVTVVVTA